MGKKIYTDKLNDPRFVKFIHKHHVMTVSTSSHDQPWCAACFYAFNSKIGAFVFTSDDNTRHISEILTNKRVAANIILETKLIGIIQGLQISGIVERIDNEKMRELQLSYVKKFPFAILANTSLWALYPNSLKLTDNKLGFGTKLIWQKDL